MLRIPRCLCSCLRSLRDKSIRQNTSQRDSDFHLPQVKNFFPSPSREFAFLGGRSGGKKLCLFGVENHFLARGGKTVQDGQQKHRIHPLCLGGEVTSLVFRTDRWLGGGRKASGRGDAIGRREESQRPRRCHGFRRYDVFFLHKFKNQAE